jgi:hypothetical protein
VLLRLFDQAAQNAPARALALRLRLYDNGAHLAKVWPVKV